MSKVAKAVGAVVAIGLAGFTFGASVLAGSLGLSGAAAAGASALFAKLGSYGFKVRDRHGNEWGPA